jgi:hypothetical protein
MAKLMGGAGLKKIEANKNSMGETVDGRMVTKGLGYLRASRQRESQPS